MFRGLGAEQISHVLKASRAINTYALIDGRIRELFFNMFRDRDYQGSLVNDARFLQLVLKLNSRGVAQKLKGMSVPTAFESQLYFHTHVMFRRKV